MLATALVADVTDTPVWFLFGATAALALVTAILGGAAIYALNQLREVRRDRDVHVLTDLGRRWDEELLTHARELEFKYSPDELAAFEARLNSAQADDPVDPGLRHEWIALTRIPNFFEDMALIAESGKIELKLVARSFKDLIVDEWDQWAPTIEQYKNHDDYRYWYSNFRQLAEDVKVLPDELIEAPIRRKVGRFGRLETRLRRFARYARL